jgi:hypothetical protein
VRPANSAESVVEIGAELAAAAARMRDRDYRTWLEDVVDMPREGAITTAASTSPSTPTASRTSSSMEGAGVNSRPPPSERSAGMRYVGIDVACETHVVAVVGAEGEVLLKPTSFTEDAVGHEKLLGLLQSPADTLVAMEATGHYWKNLFTALAAAGFEVALLNPLRTRRFADEDLERTKTDAIRRAGHRAFREPEASHAHTTARLGDRGAARARASAGPARPGVR